MYLREAYLCQDCNWIGDQQDSCEKCASSVVHTLSGWVNRKTSSTIEPSRIVALNRKLDEVIQ